MNRLTNDKTAQDLKDICEGLEAVGQTPAMTHLRYIKLAEYEQTGLEHDEIQQAWISVEDRMPDPLQNVIICTDINTVTLAWINGAEWCFADQGNGKIERYGFEAVTYWMPLPEPPKEVQDDAENKN